MKTRLTLHLTTDQADTVDWLMTRKGFPQVDRHPRDVVGALLLDYARELRGRDEHLANVQRAQNNLRAELDALRGERGRRQGAGGRALQPPPRPRTARRAPRQPAQRPQDGGARTAVPLQVSGTRRPRRGSAAAHPAEWRPRLARKAPALSAAQGRVRVATTQHAARPDATPAEAAQRRGLPLRPCGVRVPGALRRAVRTVFRETSRDATCAHREPGLASLPKAHNVARIRSTHSGRLQKTARLTPADGLLGCAAIT